MSEIRLEVIDNGNFQVRRMAFAITNAIMVRIGLPSMVQSAHNIVLTFAISQCPSKIVILCD